MNHLKLYQEFKSIFEQAGNQVTVKIEVIDEEDEPIEFPNVKVTNESGKKAAAGSGNDSGEFEFKVDPGTYTILCGAAGYEKFEKKYEFKADNQISISLKSKELKEVEIESKKLIIEIRDSKNKKKVIKNSICEILDEEENLLKVKKIEDGLFEFNISGTGSFTIRCRAEGYDTIQNKHVIDKENFDNYDKEKDTGVFHPIFFLKPSTESISGKTSEIGKTEETPLKQPSPKKDEMELDPSYLDKFIARCPNLRAVMEEYGLSKANLRIFAGEKGGRGNTFTQNKVKTSLNKNFGIFGGGKSTINLVFAHKVTMRDNDTPKGGYNNSYYNLAIQKQFNNKKSFDKAIKEYGKTEKEFEESLEQSLKEIIGSLAKIGEGYVNMEEQGYWLEIFGLNPEQTLRVLDTVKKY